MSIATAATVTQAVTLRPHLKRKLAGELEAWAEVKRQMKALEATLDMHKANIEQIQEQSGATVIEQDGFLVTRVTPKDRRSLNELELRRQGVTQTQIDAATELKPVKPYTKVTLPEDREKGNA